MKKLNRKGFTLVELLAVIVILAIVVGITLVTLLPTIEKSRKEGFDIAVEAVQKYIQDQVDMELIGGLSTTGVAYNSAVAQATSGDKTTGDVLKAAGDYDTNIEELKWTVTNGRVSITCATANPNGDYRQSDTYSACN